jgi:hypothetical protein
MHIMIRNVNPLTDLSVFDLREDASVPCTLICKRANSNNISHVSGARNGGGLIEFRGTQVDF